MDDYYWVLAAPFRALLLRMIELTGLPWAEVAGRAHLPLRLVHTLLFGHRGRTPSRIPRDCAERILALEREFGLVPTPAGAQP